MEDVRHFECIKLSSKGKDSIGILCKYRRKTAIYNITKEMFQQLRETGMNWRSIATSVGISDQTLYRRRIEFGLENNFTEKKTDKELDKQIQQTLNVTPYGGETYVRGSLKDRGINIQRLRIRESM